MDLGIAISWSPSGHDPCTSRCTMIDAGALMGVATVLTCLPDAVISIGALTSARTPSTPSTPAILSRSRWDKTLSETFVESADTS